MKKTLAVAMFTLLTINLSAYAGNNKASWAVSDEWVRIDKRVFLSLVRWSPECQHNCYATYLTSRHEEIGYYISNKTKKAIRVKANKKLKAMYLSR